MLDDEPILEETLQDPLLHELRRTVQGVFVYTGNENDIELNPFSTLLLNFKRVLENSNLLKLHTLIKAVLSSGKALVLLNVHDGQPLAKILGIGFAARCVLIKPYHQYNYNVIHVLGLAQSELADYAQSNVIQDTDGNRCFSLQDAMECEPLTNGCQTSFLDLSVAKQARMIEGILTADFQVPQELSASSLGDTPADLPAHQFKLNYLVIERKWNLSDQQIANNSVVMEIALIASYNPQYKYLRIRSVGAGFNPANGGEMQANNTYDRGYFQSRIKIHMQPNTNKLTTLSTEPKNVNKQAQYTTSSQFSVGVDVSKNPSFNSSYTVSESLTTVVSDFNIYNNGAGVTADWDFQLAMTENSIWDIFNEPFMKKGQVKELPALATKNLQAVTEAVWFAPNTLNETLGVQLYWKADYYHCWVTGDWTEYTKHYHHIWTTIGYTDTPVYLDFSSVYA